MQLPSLLCFCLLALTQMNIKATKVKEESRFEFQTPTNSWGTIKSMKKSSKYSENWFCFSGCVKDYPAARGLQY
jgi:hypothetical protein